MSYMTKDGSDREASVRRVSGRLHAAPIGSSKAPPCSDAAAEYEVRCGGFALQRLREKTRASVSRTPGRVGAAP